ncbi:hypothetical protein ACOSQ3_028663 [Xanthoceras sorbifolium]
MKVVPPVSYVFPPFEDILEAISKDVTKERALFATGIDEEESDEERLVSSNAKKDKDPIFKEPRVVLDSGSTVRTTLLILLTEIARNS